MKKWFVVSLALLCFVVFACTGCSFGATPVPVSDVVVYGQTVQGQLTGDERRWLFIGKQDDLITVEFRTSGDMPPVALLDPVGTSIARLPASLGRLERFRLPADGQFTITASGGSGDYTLSVRLDTAGSQTLTPLPTPSMLPSTNAIRLGESATGTLKSATAQDFWAFDGQADTVVSIYMEAVAGDIDPALQLFAPDGSLVTSDDNAGGGRNALIAGMRLPVTGLYLIRASGTGRSGGYRLSVEPGSPPPTATPTPTPIQPTPGPSPTPTITPTVIEAVQSGAQIRVGQTVEGTITSADQVDRYMVFGAAGTLISVGMFPAEDSSIVPSLIMYAPNGDQVGTATGATGTAVVTGAIISGYTLPSTGAYIIYVKAFRGETTGSYTLTIGDGLTLRELDGGPITPDVTVQGSVQRSGDRESWSLDLPANAMISLEAGADTSVQSKLDTLIDVAGPDGKVLATAQANPANHVVKLAATTTTAGRHLIRVSAVHVGSTGGYALAMHILKIVPTATFSVTFDQTFQEDLNEGTRFTHSFQGISGELVLVEARARVPNGFDPVIALYGPSGRRLALVDDISAENTDAILQIALDDGPGTYTVQVYGYSLTPGAFTVRIKAG